MSQSQNQQIAAFLDAGGSLTPLEALQMFGCLNLAARVYDCKRDGMDIATTMTAVGNGKRVGSYTKRVKS
jgi:hypothetical protein